jgi:hypothetical protein
MRLSEDEFWLEENEIKTLFHPFLSAKELHSEFLAEQLTHPSAGCRSLAFFIINELPKVSLLSTIELLAELKKKTGKLAISTLKQKVSISCDLPFVFPIVIINDFSTFNQTLITILLCIDWWDKNKKEAYANSR